MLELSRRTLRNARHRVLNLTLSQEGMMLGLGWILVCLAASPILLGGWQRSLGLFLYGASLSLPLAYLTVASPVWLMKASRRWDAF
ncbi:MAG: hypothetical protein IT423_13915 [Pirellulaceae bacterium]|nr:hypothetical protein [Pirellulaceae bacterium]